MSDTTSKKHHAVETIRAITAKHGSVIGVEALELKPGAVVLLVAKFAPHIDARFLEELHRSLTLLAEGLQAEGVRACGIALPDGVDLLTYEIPDTATA
jgi:hypothetical protein